MRLSLLFMLPAVLALCLACKGDKGDPGEPGPTGPQGPTGVAVGWGSSGNNVFTTLGGNVGIGTQNPTATLDVQGTLNVDQDLSLAPQHGCRSFTFTTTTGDLVDQLMPLLAKYRCVNVTLAASTNWTWNKHLILDPYQTLSITGGGYTNGANNITVNILMTQNATYTFNSVDYREPGRLSTNTGAYFALYGVNVLESARDTRPLTPNCGNTSLFNLSGQFATIDLSQLRITSTEDIVNINQRSYGTLVFGWTYVDQNTSAPRPILITTEYSGFCWHAGTMHVMRSHTYPGTNVSFTPADGHILYNE